MLTDHAPKTLPETAVAEARADNRRWLPLLFFLIPLLYLLLRAPAIGHYLGDADHGYQLGVGRQLLLGKLPFKDVFIHYGPLTAYTCMLALRIWDSPLSESIVCCAAYAAALFFLGTILNRRANMAIAASGVIGGLLLVARFHKWWYWLCPLICMYLVDKYASGKRQKLFSVLLGIMIVVGGLYRLDIGAACFVAGITGQILMNVASRRAKCAGLPWLVAGIGTAALVWFSFLGWQSGWNAIGDYISFSLAGIFTQVKNVHRVPPLHLVLTTCSVLLTYFVALGICLRMVSRTSDSSDRVNAMACAVASVFGICLIPQAIHLFQADHLVTVIPPFIITTGILAARLAERNRRKDFPVSRLAVMAYCLVLLVVCCRTHPGKDLSSFSRLRGRYAELAGGIHSRPDDPSVQMIEAAQRMTRPQDRVLVLPQGGSQPIQMYNFLERPMSGVVAIQWGGVFTENQWRLRSIASIKRDPPTIVVAGSDFIYRSGPWWQKWYPELYAYVRDNYRKIAYRRDGWLILCRQ